MTDTNTILSYRAIQALIIRELREAGGNLPEPDLYERLERAGVSTPRARGALRYLMHVQAAVVRVTQGPRRDERATLHLPNRNEHAA